MLLKSGRPGWGSRVPGCGLYPAAVCSAMSRVLLYFPSHTEESGLPSVVPPLWREGFIGSGCHPPLLYLDILSVRYGGTQPCGQLRSPLLGPCVSPGRVKVMPGSFFLTPYGGRSLRNKVPECPVVSGKVHSALNPQVCGCVNSMLFSCAPLTLPAAVICLCCMIYHSFSLLVHQ